VRPSLIFGDAELGRLQRIFLMSSCKPQKIACIIESISNFVADISVVADQKVFSHEVISLRDSQSILLSLRAWRSLFLDTKELIVSQ
jgi:hypothetical protein